MELSQTALAILFVYGLPLGGVLCILYRITDLEGLTKNALICTLVHIKDFLFVLIAGIAIVLFVYYANDGDFRYLAIIGTIAGYAGAELLLGRIIVNVRNTLLRTAFGIISVPVEFFWRLTFGAIISKAQNKSLFRYTRDRVKKTVLKASNGFENITEAKEWMKRESSMMQ